MKNHTVDDLIIQLQNIRIEEAAILEQLKAARVQELQDRKPVYPRRTVGGTRSTVDLNPFKSGDRVKITNKVRLPRGRAITPKDRLATVNNVEGDKVYFTTDNDTTTWRLHHNLTGSPSEVDSPSAYHNLTYQGKTAHTE